MCGILGCATLTPVTRDMLGYLGYEMELRGRDSWGATNGDPSTTIRVLGPLVDTWFDHESTIHSWSRAIIHTRGASVGAITVPNQHPFEFTNPDTGVRITGIHNGCVSNYEELNKRYDVSYDVDSMHIFAALVLGRPTSDICGWGNLAWFQYDSHHPDGALYLLKFNADALHVCELETGEIVFASVHESIRRAALMAGSKIKHHFKVDDEHLYHIESVRDASGAWVRDAFIDDRRKIVFGTRYFQSAASTYPNMMDWEQWGEDRRSGRRYGLGLAPGPATRTTIHNVQSDARRNSICAAPGCDKRVATTRRSNLLCTDCYTSVFRTVSERLESEVAHA